MLQHRGDILTLETQTRFAQVAGGNERRRGAPELQRRKQMLDLDYVFARVRHDAFERSAQLADVAGPGERAHQGERRLREAAPRHAVRVADVVEQPRAAATRPSPEIDSRSVGASCAGEPKSRRSARAASTAAHSTIT